MNVIRIHPNSQLRAVLLYRAKAHEALLKAREARQDGETLAMRGYLDEARCWIQYASECTRRARTDSVLLQRLCQTRKEAQRW
jgi:hypothetical protein